MTGWAREVMMRSRLRPNRISSRFQIMRTARTSSAIDVPTSRTPITAGAALIASSPCGAHPGAGPVALGTRRLCVADGAARVGHEHVVEGGTGDVDRADGEVGVGKESRHELLAVRNEERHRPL